MIADRRDNLFGASPERVRQFAGHWYVIRTPEPNLTELQSILNGTARFYAFLAEQGLIETQAAQYIARQCAATYY